jgi:hypothetical protein
VNTPQNEFPETSADRFQIDIRYLTQQLPSLVSVERKRRTWDEHGAKVTLEALSGKRPLSQAGRGLSGKEDLTWNRAKALAHAVIISNKPEYSAIRKQLGDWRNRSTAALLSTLSLWMAGTLGVSITAMRPMLATMLYGVAATGGDWDVLLESEYDDDSDPEGLT